MWFSAREPNNVAVAGPVVTKPSDFDTTMVTTTTSATIGDIDVSDLSELISDLYNQKGSSVAATLSMVLVIVIHSFFD